MRRVLIVSYWLDSDELGLSARVRGDDPGDGRRMLFRLDVYKRGGSSPGDVNRET